MKQNNEKDGWAMLVMLVLAIFFLSSAFPVSGDTKVDKRRKYTNLFGVAVFLLFIVAICSVKGYEWHKAKKEAQKRIVDTNAQVYDLAWDIAFHIKEFPTPAPVDSWGNPLEENRTDKGVSILSAGPDGEYETEDDIKSYEKFRKKSLFPVVGEAVAVETKIEPFTIWGWIKSHPFWSIAIAVGVLWLGLCILTGL